MNIQTHGKTLIAIGVAAVLSACGSSDSESEQGGNTGSNPNTYTVSTQVTGPGSLSPTNHQMTSDETLAMQVNADEGASLDAIAGCDGQLNSNQTQYTISNLTSDCTVQATFVEEDTGIIGGENVTVGRSQMSFTAFLVNSEVSPLDVAIEGSGDAAQSGTFTVDLSDLEDDQWVLIKATGGLQLDPDYTGNYQTEIAVHDAELYGFAQVRDWKAGANLTALSDIAWRLTEEWVGNMPMEEVLLRHSRVIASMSSNPEWSEQSMYSWSMEDRKGINNNPLVDFVAEQLSTNGSIVVDAEYEGGYFYYIDKDIDSDTVRDKAAILTGLSSGAQYSGEKYNRVAVTIFGPGATQSSVDGLTIDDNSMSGVGFIEKGVATHTVTALEDATQGIVFTAWKGCPNVLDRLTCEFSGLQPRDISASFRFEENVYADGYAQLTHTATRETIDEQTHLFLADSLSFSDIEKLKALSSGGYISHVNTDGGLIARVLSSEQDNAGNFIVMTEDAPIDEIFIQGSFDFQVVDTIYDFVDENGNVIAARVGDSFTMHGAHVQINEGGRILYKALNDDAPGEGNGRDSKSVTLDVLSADISSLIDIDISLAGIHFLEGWEYLSADIVGDTVVGIDISASLSPTVSINYSLWKPRRVRQFIVTPLFGNPITIQHQPEFKFKGHASTQDVFHAGAAWTRTYRNGFSLHIPYFGLANARDVTSISIVDTRADIDYGGFLEDTTINVAAGLELSLETSFGFFPLEFLFTEAALGTDIKATLSQDMSDPESACEPLKTTGSVYASAKGSAGIDIFGRELFKNCRACGPFMDTIADLKLPLIQAKTSRSMDLGLGESLNDYLNTCSSDVLRVESNYPEQINYTVGYHPLYEEFKLYFEDLDGKWIEGKWTPVDHLFRKDKFTYFDLRASNVSGEGVIPLISEVQTTHSVDGSYNFETDPFLEISLSNGNINEEVMISPNQNQDVWLRLTPLNNIDINVANELANRSFEYLFTFTNGSPGSDQVEEQRLTFKHSWGPDIRLEDYTKNRFVASLRSDYLTADVWFSELPSVRGNEDWLYLLSYLEAYIVINGQEVPVERVSRGPNYLDGNVIRISHAIEDESSLGQDYIFRIKYGFDGDGYGDAQYQYDIEMPACQLVDPDDLDYERPWRRWVCKPVYDLSPR